MGKSATSLLKFTIGALLLLIFYYIFYFSFSSTSLYEYAFVGGRIIAHEQQPVENGTDNQELIFTSHLSLAPVAKGKPFSANLLPLLSKFGLTSHNRTIKSEVKAEDVVFVTYSSSNHFHESRAGLFKLRKLVPNNIVYYDVGLAASEAEDVKKFCNLEYRKFNFSAYPNHVKILNTYAFKAIVEAEVFAKHPAFWMFDASLRITNMTTLSQFYEQININSSERFVISFSAGHSIYSATFPGMFDYLPATAEQRMAVMRVATSFISHSEFSKQAVKWNFLCAMTEQCIAPSGHKLYCVFTNDRMKDFANCHRYDQSAINLILTSLREKYGVRSDPEKPRYEEFLAIKGGDMYSGSFDPVCKVKST